MLLIRYLDLQCEPGCERTVSDGTMFKRGVFLKDLSQTRVVPVKEVRAVKLKGTNICLEGIQINLLMSCEETSGVACFLRFKQNDMTK